MADLTSFAADIAPGGGGTLANALAIGASRQQQVDQFSSSHLRASLERSRQDRNQFRGLRNRAAAAISNDPNRERFALRKNAALMAQAGTAQQGPPTSFASAVNQATRRGKARYSIVNRGDKAIANQNLRDRLTFAKAGMNRTTGLQTMMQKLANIREGVNVGVSDARQDIAASNAALGGSVLGGVSGFLAQEGNRDWLKNIFRPQNPNLVTPDQLTPPPPPPMPDGS